MHGAHRGLERARQRDTGVSDSVSCSSRLRLKSATCTFQCRSTCARPAGRNNVRLRALFCVLGQRFGSELSSVRRPVVCACALGLGRAQRRWRWQQLVAQGPSAPALAQRSSALNVSAWPCPSAKGTANRLDERRHSHPPTECQTAGRQRQCSSTGRPGGSWPHQQVGRLEVTMNYGRLVQAARRGGHKATPGLAFVALLMIPCAAGYSPQDKIWRRLLRCALAPAATTSAVEIGRAKETQKKQEGKIEAEGSSHWR